jgi:uncharacterized membrane protein
MDLFLILHITAGALGLLSGYTALYSAKGASLHRKSGMMFVYVMLPMALSGLLIASLRNTAPAVNIPAALLTAYLVVTSLTTVKPPSRGGRLLHIAGMILALSLGLVNLKLGAEAIAGGGTRQGIPAFPFFMFAAAALFGTVGDARMLKSGALRGPYRLARHLWRMCFALFIAALSFFIGQADVIPKPIRIRPLLALPVLAVLLTMIYWIWRIRFRRSLRGITASASAEIA